MTRPRRAVIVNSAVFTLAVLFGLAVTSARAQDVVKIGQIEAQTGANAIYGWMSSQGTALAVDEINKAGGFKVGSKTYKIQLIALDTRGEPKEATVQLKQHDTTRTIPVIALTALAMKGDKERILAAGCDGYIAKPLRYKEFLATIAASLARA